MCFRFPKFVFLLVMAVGTLSLRADEPTTQPLVLRIAADPNNLPFSNDKLEGFENKIAELIARDLDAKIEYTFWAQRRGFFRDTLKHGNCNVVMGVPAADFERALPTKPYYRSSYVFVSRTDRKLDLHSLDDPALRSLRIGVQLIGGANSTPPALALARRNIIDNVHGYTIYSDYREPNPTSNIIEAVARGEVDVAIVWGPLGGFFARKSDVPMTVTPVSPQIEGTNIPLAFDIAIGVKRGQKELLDRIDEALSRHRGEIEKILDEYGVPRVPQPGAQ